LYRNFHIIPPDYINKILKKANTRYVNSPYMTSSNAIE
jgi:hypothetical protein